MGTFAVGCHITVHPNVSPNDSIRCVCVCVWESGGVHAWVHGCWCVCVYMFVCLCAFVGM